MPSRNNEPNQSEPRRDADVTLARLRRDESGPCRGRLKLFLGFAAGVGKTYEMLSEANRRRNERGQDVVIGYLETHGRKGTMAQIGSLEQVPRMKMEYRGAQFEEMDVDAVLARKPTWAVVDELAHTNIPGSRHVKRYEDIVELLEHGINVLSTMNIQHLESLNDVVQQITGIKVRETVPDSVMSEADEIVTIDITPRALIHRLERGDVYPTDKAPSALRNFFTEGNLSALREIALREVAGEVDRSVQSYREEHQVSEPWHTQERVMICLSPDRLSDNLLRRGHRIAHRLRAELMAVYVAEKRLTPEQAKLLDADRATAARLNIPVEEIAGSDVAQALADFAIRRQVTEIVIGHSLDSNWKRIIRGSIVARLIRMVPDIDVLVLTNKTK